MNQRDPTAKAMAHGVPINVEALLEATGRGEMTTSDLTVALAKHCRGNVDAVWETLALADQYFRRRRIDADIFAAIKLELHALVFPQPKPSRPEQQQSTAIPASVPTSVPASVKNAAGSEPPREATSIRIPTANQAQVNTTQIDEASANKRPVKATTTNSESLVTPGAAAGSREEGNAGVLNRSVPAAVKPLDKQRIYSHEPVHSPGVSAMAKVFMGLGALLVVAVAISFVLLISKPAPTLHKVAVNSSPSPAQQAVVAPPSDDTGAGELPTVAETPSSAPPVDNGQATTNVAIDSVERVASAQDIVTSAPISEPSATASPPIVTEVRGRPTISFVVDPILVEQGDSVARIVVHRSGSTRREWSVPWRTLEGSAKAERDFVATNNGVLLFSPGARDAVILVPIVKDSTRQHSDWFEVEVMIDSAVSTNAPQDSALRATIVIATVQAAGEGESVSPRTGPSAVPSNESGADPNPT